jgi:hypothetical protein
MKITYVAYKNFRINNPNYKDDRRIVPGDIVDMPDGFRVHFKDEEVLEYRGTKENVTEGKPGALTTEPAPTPPPKDTRTPKEKYEDHVKSQIKDQGADIPLTDATGKEITDDFILDFPDVREKVKQKYENRKNKKKEG